MDKTLDVLKQALEYVLNVLVIAWNKFTETTQIDAAAIILYPGLISVVSILVIGYVYFLVRR
jgi:hypothetical protein